MKRFVSLVMFVALAVSAAIAWAQALPAARPEQVGLSSERLDRIGPMLRGEIEKGKFPGAVALVARKGRIAYFESFGLRDKATGARMTNDTIFRIYSMTKPPSVHVLPGGPVGVSYYDFRNNTAGGGTDTDYFLVHCHAACSDLASWMSNETQITMTSFDSRLAPVARGFFLGDYVGLDDTGTAFSALYTEGVSAANPTDEFYSTVSP